MRLLLCRFGCSCISWARLVKPTVEMCRKGITVSWTHANTLAGTTVDKLIKRFETKAYKRVYSKHCVECTYLELQCKEYVHNVYYVPL